VAHCDDFLVLHLPSRCCHLVISDVVRRYFMSVGKTKAVGMLQMRSGHDFQHPDGAFIVRPSESNPDDLSLSVR